MNLVIDTFKLVKGAGKSIGIYNLTKSIVHYLGAENVRRGNPETILIFGNEFNREDMETDGVVFIPMKGNPLSKTEAVRWELFESARQAKRYAADRILFPRGYRPLVYRGKDTIIIHDLIPFYYDRHYPGYFNRIENAYIMNRLKASMKGADRIITISDFSLREIRSMVPSAEGRITEIYNGLNDMADFEKTPELEREASEQPYIAAVTSGLPHKNAVGILKAYHAYRQLCSEAGETPLGLFVIGTGDIAPFIEQGILTEEEAARVRCSAYFPQYADLCRTIYYAQQFLFLSYAEGFGFPPLEAMQLDTPVICSSRTSLPEVVGEAGILVDPDDLHTIGERILQLQRDPARRQELVEKGRENLKKFSWESRTGLYWEELFRS